MKTLIYITLPMLLAINANAAKIMRCADIDATQTYSLLCSYGSKDDPKCKGYTITDGISKIHSTGPIVSKQPYIIKTPDMQMDTVVDCKTFSAVYNKPLAGQTIDKLVYTNYKNKLQTEWPINQQTLNTSGSLFISFNKVWKKTPNMASLKLTKLESEIKQYTSNPEITVNDTRSVMLVKNITILEALMIRQFYPSKLYDIKWTDENGYINIKGYQ